MSRALGLGLLELLELRGFDRGWRAKLVRHRDPRYDVQELARKGWLDAYQAFQSRPIFDGLGHIVSFVGLEGSRARLAGIYRVGRRRPSARAPIPHGCPYQEWRRAGHFYELAREPSYADLENRVVIDWGLAALAWHQRLRDK